MENQTPIQSAAAQPTSPLMTPNAIPAQRNPSSKGGHLTLIILAVLAVLFLGGGYYFIAGSKPTPDTTTITQPPAASASASTSAKVDETASWKTYTNTTHNYEIKYPDSWYTQEVAPGAKEKAAGPTSEIVDILDTVQNSGGAPKHALEITALGPATATKGYEKSEVTLGGKPATKYVGSTGDKTTVVYLLGLTGKKQLEISYSYQKESTSDEALYSQILATFKISNLAAGESLLAENICKQADNGRYIEGDPECKSEISILFPTNFEIIKHDYFEHEGIAQHTMKVGNAEYTVWVNNGKADICNGKTDCTYDDLKLSGTGISSDTLRVWKDSAGTVALNAQGIVVNERYINSIIVQKTKPTVYFSASEETMWKSSFLTIKTSH